MTSTRLLMLFDAGNITVASRAKSKVTFKFRFITTNLQKIYGMKQKILEKQRYKLNYKPNRENLNKRFYFVSIVFVFNFS